MPLFATFPILSAFATLFNTIEQPETQNNALKMEANLVKKSLNIGRDVNIHQKFGKSLPSFSIFSMFQTFYLLNIFKGVGNPNVCQTLSIGISSFDLNFAAFKAIVLMLLGDVY